MTMIVNRRQDLNAVLGRLQYNCAASTGTYRSRRRDFMMKLLSTASLLLIPFFSGSVLHAQNGPKIKHVLVISIDGMHSQDLDKWIKANPKSALAQLQATGVNYPNAFSTQPSDSIPAAVGIFTGASPALA